MIYIYIFIYIYKKSNIYMNGKNIYRINIYIYIYICIYIHLRKNVFFTTCVKNKGCVMYNSDAISILNFALDNPCFFHRGPEIIFRKSIFQKTRLRIQACCFFKLLVLSSWNPQTMGVFLHISIARRKCLCVPRKVAL